MTTAHYNILIDDYFHTARVVKDEHSFSPRMSDEFIGSTYKCDAMRWVKRVGGKNATFNFEDVPTV